MKHLKKLTILFFGLVALAGCQDNQTTGDTKTASSTVADTAQTGAESLPSGALYPDAGFDFENHTVELNSGYQMPILGLGTYSLSNDEAEESVYTALTNGGRLIDTASIYGNEAGVGRGIQRANIPREEIFVTTKLWTDDYDDAEAAIEESLDRLGLDYVDLVLLHHSADNDQEAYQALENMVNEGKIRSIGLSNYSRTDFAKLADAVDIPPAVLQNESHPYRQQIGMKEFLQQYGTKFEGWFPFGGRGNTDNLFNDETLAAIAEKYGKTVPQVILRWHLQAGSITIPGSSDPDHIRENLNVFDFNLSAADMQQIHDLNLHDLNRNERFSTY